MNRAGLNAVLGTMLDFSHNISDLNFSPGKAPQVEVSGALVEVPFKGMKRLTPFQTEQVALALLGDDRLMIKRLLREGSADISYSIPGRTRFRVNIFRQRGSYSIVLRVIPYGVPDIEDLGLPEAIKWVADEKNGIVLVTGPTGSGKSTTLAAIINKINNEKAYHIVTIEDPIEYMHRHKKSTVNQRELGPDTPTFGGALRAALRQAPKVILVGEMRDVETIEIALEAAETGHLVLSTLHTIDAAKTIDRIVGVFPKNEEQAIRTRFSQSFRWVISQRLVPKNGGGRVAVLEMLRSTMRTREYVQEGEGEGKSLLDAMIDGSLDGMQAFDGELEKLVRENVISYDNGMAYATNRGNLELRLSGIGGTSETSGAMAQEKEEPAADDGSFGDIKDMMT